MIANILSRYVQMGELWLLLARIVDPAVSLLKYRIARDLRFGYGVTAGVYPKRAGSQGRGM